MSLTGQVKYSDYQCVVLGFLELSHHDLMSSFLNDSLPWTVLAVWSSH